MLGSGSGQALSYCGNQGDQLTDRPDVVLTAEGWEWASSAVSYQGPGQSSVVLHHGVSDVGGLLDCFKPNMEGGALCDAGNH